MRRTLVPLLLLAAPLATASNAGPAGPARLIEATAPAPDAASDPAWEAYERAFRDAEAGKDVRESLEGLVRTHPDHPAARQARELMRMLDALERGRAARAISIGDEVPVGKGPSPASSGIGGERLRAEEPTGLARAELAIFQTANGIALGAELCVFLDCNDVRPFVATMLLGGGGGLAASLFATRESGITPGLALAIDSGTAWGAWHGIALTLTIDDLSSRGAGGVMMAGQLAGTAAGAALGTVLRPSAGDVSLGNSAGIWAGVMMLLFNAANEFDLFNEDGNVLSLLVASDLGLVAGGLLARDFPMSRGRTLIIDAGGILGMLLGFGIDVLIEGGEVEPARFFGIGLAGTAAGLAAGAALSRGWDAEDPEPTLGFAPIRGGAMLTATMMF